MKPFFALMLSLLPVSTAFAATSPAQLRCESRIDPLGIDVAAPRLSWILTNSDDRARGVSQTAYQVLVASSAAVLGRNRGDLWDSHQVQSSQNLRLTYRGQSLKTAQQVFWKVRVWDEKQRRSAWSAPAQWTMGLLQPQDLRAQWIGFPLAAGNKAPVTVLLRRELKVKPNLRRATAFVCGLGHYEMSLNGAKVGTDLLAPGWTKYDKTCLYDTRDLTSQLKVGSNAVGLFLGNGMYNVAGGRYSKFKNSFGPLKALVQIRLEYADGRVETLGSDASWQVAPGPITFDDVFGGEDFDARLEPRGWNEVGFAAADWKPASIAAGPGGVLKGLSVGSPPIRAFETFSPVAIRALRPGVAVYDMGQNAAVMPRLKVSGPAGTRVRLVPGELVRADGSVDQTSSGGPAYWQYTLSGGGSGGGIETYFAKFFYRGCRYVQVECSAPDGVALPVVQSLETVAVHADSPAVGTFSCSNPLFNRIFPLVKRAQESNMMSVMTDCPHREKLGWLEEDHLNGPALRFNFDMSALFAKVMNDIADSQGEGGFVPTTAPEYPVFGGDFRDSPEWSSAFLLIGWQQWQFNGDFGPLAAHYDALKKYLGYLDSRAKAGILSYGLGDWYDIGPGEPGYSKLTPKGLTATAFYYEDTRIMAQVAALLGRRDEAAQFQARAGEIRAAFNAQFFNSQTGQYGSGSQTSNALPLVMDLVEPQNRAQVLQNLVLDVQTKGLTAGDVGYRYLLRALADGGRSDVIYALNNGSERPGYGLILARGATSLTEAWDAHASSSQNHFMLGQINEWFYHDLAGIQFDPAVPGWKHIVIKPAIVGDLGEVSATYNSDFGLIQSHWTRSNQRLRLQITIPANTTASVYLPAQSAAKITESRREIAAAQSVSLVRMEGGAAVLEVGSGHYDFESVFLPD